MNQELLLKRIAELEEQNYKLRKRLNKRNHHSIIKTTKKEIVDYWGRIQDECGLSVDWAEAEERCWRCGYKARLERCHIIPDSLGGEDTPSNFVLLCSRYHIDAPNVESKTFMWDWIRANGTPLYDTFWEIRAQKEYEFVYGKSFRQELKDRDILSAYDLSILRNLEIGRSIYHFAHPWKNESTMAGILRMRIEKFDETHPIIKKKSAAFRAREEDFYHFLYDVCNLAKKYNWNVWEGGSKNRLSVTLSTRIERDKKQSISIKLFKDNIYRACFTNEINANNTTSQEYKIELGTRKEVIEYLKLEMEKFTQKYGMTEKQDFVFTWHPYCRLKDDEDDDEE